MKNAPKGQKQKVEPGWVTPLNAQPSQKANKKVEAKVVEPSPKEQEKRWESSKKRRSLP